MMAKIVRLCVLFLHGLFPMLFPLASSFALDWHRGILQIDHMDSSIQMQKYGETSPSYPEFNLPIQMTDLAEFSSESEAIMCFRLSTGMMVEWNGPGKFSIDRFEHSWLPSSLSAGESEYARALLYLNRGRLFIDAEQLSDATSLVIETPLGTLLGQNAIFAIDVENFRGGEKKNCTLYCFSGSVRFEGHDGTSLELSQGNKLALLFNEGMLKETTMILDASDQILWDQFNRQRQKFSNPQQFPERILPNLEEALKPALEDAPVQPSNYFYMPVLPTTPSFNHD